MVSPASYHSITLADTRIAYLPDGHILFSPKVMLPTSTDADWRHYQHLLDSDGQLVGSMGAYIVQTPEHTILIDAGFGPQSFDMGSFKAYGGTLLSSLKLAGLEPADIDIVFFTHVHSDHVGWTGHEVNGEQVLTFPNAHHLMRNTEWHRFDDPTERRPNLEVALNLLEPCIELVEEGEHIIPEVMVLATPGHTIGHTSLLVTIGEQRVIILGDIFHSIAQIDHPDWTNLFDSNPEQAKATRRHMLQELARPSTIGIGTHFSTSVFGQLTRVQEDTFQWQIQQ